jgi:hypothetical protein
VELPQGILIRLSEGDIQLLGRVSQTTTKSLGSEIETSGYIEMVTFTDIALYYITET